MFPLVSIVIPVYNSEKYIDECLQSVISQTYPELEIICVDDGSTDRSVEILRKYEAEDKRIIIIEKVHHDGTGAGEARNVGLSVANGEYVQFLDSDDYFEKSLIESLVNEAQIHSADIVITDAWKIDGRTGIKSDYRDLINISKYQKDNVFSGDEYSDSIFQLCNGTVWNMLFKREFLNENNLKFQCMRFTDDNLFSYMAMILAQRIKYVSLHAINYRYYMTNSQTQTSINFPEIMYLAGWEIKKELIKRKIYKKHISSFCKKYIPHMMYYLIAQYENAGKHFRFCINKIKTDIWDKFDVDYYINNVNEGIEFERWKSVLQYIKRHSYEDISDLFSNNKLNAYGVAFPCCISRKKVVLYGAGDVGRRIYDDNREVNYFTIVKWVDANYQNYDSEICSPDDILTEEYDYILIASVINNNICSIKQYLSNMQIEEGRIVCLEVKAY